MRIAITSPDILAQIRQVFASKNLDVDIVRMPYVEVRVRPAGGAAPTTDRSAVGAALQRVVVPASPPGAMRSRRLCAEYRLNVIEVGDSPGDEPPIPEDRSGAAPAAHRAVDGRGTVLSQRQHEVMALVSRGLRNAEIAARLDVSEKTVKNHINRIFRLLDVSSRVEAVLNWQGPQMGGPTRRLAPNPPWAQVAGRRPGNGGNP
ncbi:LuxR C-terminal-related transcriptional regulator [Streptomyces sp. CG1]|uniref:helix-turn-helix transcriptional regulator n=1 Tax=Streptomyces sp. CG1 TaxID=1287523 RepID=UPI0034E1A534